MIASIRSRLLHLAELTNEEIFARLDSPVASKLIREMGTGCIDVCVRESTHARNYHLQSDQNAVRL